MAPRVLYLHGLRGTSGSKRYRSLVEVYGKDAVRSPNMKTRRTIILFTIGYILFVGALCTASAMSFVHWTIFESVVTTILCILFGCLVYILVGRGMTHQMVKRATRIAEKEFHSFRPNVIVASSFGAIVAFNMEVPRVSLVLLAPAQDSYCRYMKIREFPSLLDYPYVIIVHGSNDDSINLDDSIRLVETSTCGRCKLEVIDDNHTLKTLCEGDYKEFVDEAYEKGRKEIMEMPEDDITRPLRLGRGRHSKYPTIDPTLFDLIGDETVEPSAQPSPSVARLDPFLTGEPPIEEDNEAQRPEDLEAEEEKEQAEEKEPSTTKDTVIPIRAPYRTRMD